MPMEIISNRYPIFSIENTQELVNDSVFKISDKNLKELSNIGPVFMYTTTD